MAGSLLRAPILAAVGIAACVGVALAANSGSFLDAGGDADTSPDITRVAITNDDAGIVTVTLTLGNRATWGGDDLAAIGVDTDQNPDTGSVFYGAEYELNLQGTTAGVLQAKPDGDYTPGLVPPSLHAAFTGGAVTFSFKASDFGLSAGFNLYTLTVDRSNAYDEAPDIRTINYQLVGGTQAPALGADRRAPVVVALKSSGVHGGVARLDYVAADGRAETAESIVVYRGRKVLRRMSSRLADTNPFLVYFARWSVPKKIRGKLRFCVTSRDRAGNKSKTSCAALTIK
jgi:hypothetical protein